MLLYIFHFHVVIPIYCVSWSPSGVARKEMLVAHLAPPLPTPMWSLLPVPQHQ